MAHSRLHTTRDSTVECIGMELFIGIIGEIAFTSICAKRNSMNCRGLELLMVGKIEEWSILEIVVGIFIGLKVLNVKVC